MLIRNLPLARLRAHDRLIEVRAGDLRFTSHEIGRSLDEVMGLSLSPGDIAALDEKDDPSLQAQWLALQSTVRNTQREPMQSLTLASRALEIVPATDHHMQSLIYLGLADAYQQLDHYAHAAEAFQMIVHHGRAATNQVVEIIGIAGVAAMATRREQLHHAFEIASHGVDRVERSGSLPPISAVVYGVLGHVYYQWNQLERPIATGE